MINYMYLRYKLLKLKMNLNIMRWCKSSFDNKLGYVALKHDSKIFLRKM